MAVKIQYETSYGITCPSAYCLVVGARIEKQHVEGDGDDSNIHHDFYVSYEGKIYFDENSRVEQKSPVGGFNGGFIMSEGDKKNHYNVIKQIYMHLKETNEKFAEAEDC